MIYLFFLIFSWRVFSSEADIPPFSHVITNVPSDYYQLGKRSFEKEMFPTWGVVLGTTALAYTFDRDIYINLRNFGRKVEGRGQVRDKQRVAYTIFNQPLRVPANTNTYFYFIGDGITQISANLAFYAYGYLGDNFRAKITAMQFTEGLIAITFLTQALKMTFGREDPASATKTRGRWSFFPGFTQYNSHLSSYDSFPSEHMATLLTSLTIISNNYPESRWWFRPFGFTLATLMGAAILMDGEHWASDYPLAIFLGYQLGNIISEKKLDKAATPELISDRHGHLGMGLSFSF